MAKKQAVWGIDIGMCAVKAMRCTVGEQPGKIVADKFDFIEFPKMLNQAEVDAEEEIRTALKQFLDRNNLKGDLVAISVPGQMGLPRFFRPPPVDLKTLPDIVKYEVKQQIPFPIEDVIWDWQQLGGVRVDDRVVDAEVGLFAMKREAVFKALKPFDDAGVEVNFIQLSPLAVLNFVTHDVFESLPNPDDFDPENPPDSTVVISMGTDTTDLIVTNGIKLWLRNIPVGGNHFTKQLSREMKLTHAKAEQLKRNAKLAEDPKSLFRAMRPVFGDLVNEVQRSLTFFRSIDKNVKLSRIVLVGNAAKLPGLRQFLTAQLEMDIVKVSEFRNLTGPDVVGQATFDENLLTFAPAYGLCIQGLKQGLLKTNLLPPEIKNERIVRAKKPWVLAAISMIMLGMLVGWFFKSNALYRSSMEYKTNDVSWGAAMDASKKVKRLSQDLMAEDQALKANLSQVNALSKELASASENKTKWIELEKALYTVLPKDPRIKEEAVDPLEVPFEDREELYIEHIETKFLRDVSARIGLIKPYYNIQFAAKEANAATGAIPPPATDEAVDVDATTQSSGPNVSGPGWVIELKGHHFHNSKQSLLKLDANRAYLIRTLIKSLNEGSFELPGEDSPVEGGGTYTYQDFGLYYPTLVDEIRIKEPVLIPIDLSVEAGSRLEEKLDDQGKKAGGEQAPISEQEQKRKAMIAQIKKDKGIKVDRYDFTVQIIWIPRSPRERFEIRKSRVEAEQAAAAKAAAPTAESEVPGSPQQ